MTIRNLRARGGLRVKAGNSLPVVGMLVVLYPMSQGKGCFEGPEPGHALC